MDLLGAFGILVRVVETGSFSAVSRERKLSQAAVARQVAQLEDHFGVRLFHRTTRKLSLTDDGQTLLGLARPVLDGVEGIEAALGQQSASPVGLVRVGVTVTASRFLSLSLPSLLADHPQLKVELVVSDRFGDMIEDRRRDHGYSLVLARRTGTAVRVAVAAPSYIQRNGEPSGPVDLENHTCIVHDVGPDSDVWTFCMSGEPKGFRVSGGFLANDVRAVHLAARAHCLSPFDRSLRRPALWLAGSRVDGLSRSRRSTQPGLSIATASRATYAPRSGLHLGAASTNPRRACHGS
jgi:DNA-binding transcriptional LysR family regulator